MMFLDFLVFVLCAVLIIGMVSQVIIPLINGTILFPLFRSKMTALEREKIRLQDELKAQQIAAEIEQLKQQTAQQTQKKDESCGQVQ